MYEIKVSGMICGSCAKSITNALKSIDPKVKVSVDIKTQIVHVESDKNEKDINALIEGAGYSVSSSQKIN